MAATAGAFSLVTRERRPDGDGPLDEQPDRRVLADRGGVEAARAAGQAASARARTGSTGRAASAAPGPGTPARRRRGARPGWSRSTFRPGRGAEQAGDDRRRHRRPARSCRGPAGRAASPATRRATRRSACRPISVTPTAAAIRGATSIWSRIGSSGTKKTPSGKSSATVVASWSDSRVFPVPPGPVIVRSRVVSNRRPASASSSSRPTNVVSWVGRLFGRVSGVRSFGNVGRQPVALHLEEPLRARAGRAAGTPRARAGVTPAGSALATSARVASEATIWPPWPAAAIRAARLTSRPTRLPPAWPASPEWRPIRTATRRVVRPRLRDERALRLDGGRHGLAGAGEDDEERVALGALLDRRRGRRTPRAGSPGAARGRRRSARSRSAPRGWSSPRCR